MHLKWIEDLDPMEWLSDRCILAGQEDVVPDNVRSANVHGLNTKPI